jgi:hypothetical protein
MAKRTLESLTLSDLKNSPVWEMANDAKSGDVLVKQVKSIPVTSLLNRLIGTQVHLADGSAVWCLLGNIETTNPLATRHFLTASLHHKRKWFNLGRYHDADFKSRDGAALARFLGKPISDVFPISYDVTDIAVGVRESLVGTISLQIDERLTAEDLINLALLQT